MSIVLPVAAKAVLENNVTEIIYRCPNDSKVSFVDFDAFMDRKGKKSNDKFNIYFSYADDPVTKTNLLVKNLMIGDIDKYAVVRKFILGKNQNLGVTLSGKGPVHYQVRGHEIKRDDSLKGGILAHVTPKTSTPTEVYKADSKKMTHVIGTLFLNTDSKSEASTTIWITNGERVRNLSDRSIDKVQMVTFDDQTTVAIENVELVKGESIVVGGDSKLTCSFMGVELNANE